MVMRKMTLLLVFLLFAGMQVIMAQSHTVTGKVTSAEDGQSLPGVQIVVKGTTVGTITDLDGNYKISTPKGSSILVFKFVGMKTVELESAGKSKLNVVMEVESTQLTGVVVTALGISREKKSLGYAVQEVGGDDLNRVKNDNVINSISGKVAGVQIKNNTNMGGSSNVVIRGYSSLTGDNQALFIVDGVPVSNLSTNDPGQVSGRSGYDYGSPVSDINPNDIENVSVLKGAAATALYGSRAANGVILITTKKGKKAAAGNSVTVELSHSTMIHQMDMSTFPVYQKNYGQGYGPYYSGPLGDGEPSDYPGLYHYDFDGDGELDYITPTTEDASMGSHYDPELMAYQWDAFYPESPNYMKKTPYVMGENGPDYFFQDGHTVKNSVAISGATEKSLMRLSYTNTDMTGIMPNSSIVKNNLNFSASYDLTDAFKISSSVNYVNTNAIGRNHTGYSDNILSSFRQWYNLGVDMKQQKDYYELTGKNITWNPHSEDDLAPIYWDNPYWQRYENYQSDTRDRIIAYTQADYQITEDLSFMAKYSMDHYTTLIEERKAIGSVAGELGVGRPDVTSGYARKELAFTESNFDAMLKYKKYLNDAVNFSALLGTNMRRSVLDQVYSSTNGGLAVPGVFSLGNSANPTLPPEEILQRIGVDGIFGSASVGIKNMLFIDGTYRYDISSTLPADNWDYGYYSLSTGFLFSELIKSDILDLGKVRVSYAQVGNDAPWGSVTDSYRIVAPFNGNTLVRFPSYKNNKDLVPEISSSLEGGLELAMFNNRLGVDLAIYKTNTVNAIIPLAVSMATGYRSKIVNIGEMVNQGIETSLRVTPVRTSNFSWNLNFNWSKNVNQVITLGDDIDNLQLASLQGGVSINAREGEPYGVIQGTDFMYSPDGKRIVKPNGYYAKTGTSDEVIGSIQPDWVAGISNSFTYKNFTASFLFDMQMGGSIFSLDQWYGMGTGLYAETDFNNDLGNPVRDPIYDADGNELLPYITLPAYDPADGYGSKSGGMILDGVVWTDTNGDGEPNEGDEFTENKRRVSGLDYRVWGWSRNPNAAFVYDATFIKLRELSISYRLPSSLFSKTFISGASVGIIGSNLWIVYKKLPYADPEASQGAGNIQGWQSGVMPATRNIGFNININF
jgi:TonB-linked SusC/RagA family outer membrane protein